MSNLWSKIFSSNRAVPPATKRQLNSYISPITDCYAITIRTVDFIQQKQNLQSKYQLQACFFDVNYGLFFGKPWKSSWLMIGDEDDTRNTIILNETLFFHTQFRDEAIVLIIELVGQKIDSETLIGWTIVRFYKVGRPIVDFNVQKAQFQRIQMNGGSAKILPFIRESLEENDKVPKINAGIQIAVQTHKLLARALDFLPNNVIFCLSDSVPGLEPARNDSPLKNPMPREPMPCTITELSVTFDLHKERLDAELCHLINAEQLFNGDKKMATKVDGEIIVTERRIRIGVHNGWTYVHQPLIFHLHSEEQAVNSRRNLDRKVGRSHPRSGSLDARPKGDTVYVRNRIDLNSMVVDSGLAIVFALEFVIVEKSTQPNASSRSVIIGWTAWSPFSSEKPPHSADIINLYLHGGPTLNPDETLCFKNLTTFGNEPNKSPNNAISRVGVQFSFTLTSQQPTVLPKRKKAKSRPKIVARNTRASVSSTETKNEAEDKGPISMDNTSIGTPAQLVNKSKSATHQVIATGRDLAPSIGAQTSPIGQLGHMIELESNPSEDSAQIVILQKNIFNISAIPRAAFAVLSQHDFPPIKDRNGNSPNLIDLQNSTTNNDREIAECLDSNEIILQFLAISSPSNSNYIDLQLPERLFLTFQFYRFPQVTTERLLVAIPHSMATDFCPNILRRIDMTGSIVSSNESGFRVKFFVDSQCLQADEHRRFVCYLLTNSLHIDIWDGDSLMLIGSSLLPLKHLIRGGLEAVQAYVQLPIVTTELSIDRTEFSTLRAVLYIKIANIGYPAVNTAAWNMAIKSLNKAVVSQKLQRKGATAVESFRIHAKPLHRLQKTIFQRFLMAQRLQVERGINEEDPFSEESHRKLKRWNNLAHMDLCAQINKRSNKRELFAQEIESYKSLRRENKSKLFFTALLTSISTVHTIFPTLGTVEFLEFPVQNPNSNAIIIDVEITDQQFRSSYQLLLNACPVLLLSSSYFLRVITDMEKWRHFKKANNLHTPLKTDLFQVMESGENRVQLLLKPNESVYIPFEYQNFLVSILEIDAKKTTDTENTISTKSLLLEAKTIRTVLKRSDNGELVSILLLQVEPKPHTVDQVFRFYHEEGGLLTKIVRLPTEDSDMKTNICAVKCTDPNALVEICNDPDGNIQDLFVKTSCGSSPSVRSFFVLLYSDVHLSEPLKIWQFFIHSLQRIDIVSTQGQSSKFAFIFRGDEATRPVRLFCSAKCIDLNPFIPFLSSPHSMTEVAGVFVPNFVGDRTFEINAVDIEQNQLVKSWIVHAHSRKANISKAYQITVPVGLKNGLNENISFINRYKSSRRFRVSTSRPDLVLIKESILNIRSNSVENIRLTFLPQKRPKIVEILLFFNNQSGNVEETYSLKTVYVINS